MRARSRTPSALLVGAVTAVLVTQPASAAPAPPEPGAAQRTAAASGARVLVVSVDGLNPRAITRLGPARTPTFHRLVRQGASTLDARTERELTLTLPNHAGMVTGRRVAARLGGHGVTWNDDRLRPRTVQQAAGHPVQSVFSVVHAHGGSTALFAAKTKFSLFTRSWPAAIDRSRITSDNAALVRSTRYDLVHHRRAFTFLHLSLPDVAGHAHGFMSPAYLRAVRRSDALVGRLLATIDRHRGLRRHLTLVVTADHGGRGPNHSDPTKLADYRVPFFVRGPGVRAGADLYALNPDYRRPGTARTTYAARRQPVRNGDVANLATDLLGLPALRGSELDARHDLDVR